jgi:putative transposase
MAEGLHRYQQTRQLHFVTFSCYHRLPYLGTAEARDLFESAMERVRVRYEWAILGYVVMPEHVHLLAGEPGVGSAALAIQALKLSVTKRRTERPFWLTRYYDFNVWSAQKETEKLDYIHGNPVKRGLVMEPQDWKWSSYRHYQTGVEGPVEIESFWTGWRRERQGRS